MKKRGQFYLVGALIIVVVVIGLLAVNNYARTRSSESNVYDISSDISREAKEVIDFGVYNTGDIPELLNNFSNSYIDAEPNKNWFFVYGDGSNVTILSYQGREGEAGSVSVDVGGGLTQYGFVKHVKNFTSFTDPEQTIKITIDSQEYEFTLTGGQNFYFIISERNSGGDNIISTGQVIKNNQDDNE